MLSLSIGDTFVTTSLSAISYQQSAISQDKKDGLRSYKRSIMKIRVDRVRRVDTSLANIGCGWTSAAEVKSPERRELIEKPAVPVGVRVYWTAFSESYSTNSNRRD
jgi:hypothetical protein